MIANFAAADPDYGARIAKKIAALKAKGTIFIPCVYNKPLYNIYHRHIENIHREACALDTQAEMHACPQGLVVEVQFLPSSPSLPPSSNLTPLSLSLSFS